MSRDISGTDIGDAIYTNKTYKMAAKAIIDPSRTYFASLTDDYPYDAGDYSTVTDTPTGQCVVYDTNGSNLVTFVVDPSTGVIYGMDQGSATKNSLGVTADNETKCGAWDLGTGSCYLWYCDSGGTLKRSTVNMSTWGVSGTTTIEPSGMTWTITRGSPTPVSSTECVYVYQTSYGGWGVSYYTGSAWENWAGRFISPNAVASDYPSASIYSTAAKFNGDIYVYWTDIKEGEVRGTVYQVSDDLWIDSYVALPSDLSRFCITNAQVANGYLHIAGQFHRTDDLANAQVYSLALRSSDGKAFSWDRFTLISKLGYQFHLGYSGDTLYASDRNSVGTANLSYFWASTPGTRVTLQPPNDIIEFSMNDNSANLRIKGYDEAYLNHSVIKKGSRCMIDIGYATDSGAPYEYIHYMDYIIDSVAYGYADGVRRITLGLVSEGIWKTDQISFPFYSEIISNSSLYDDCDEWDLMYPAPGSIYRDADVFLDLFQAEGWDGGGVTTCTPAINSSDARFKDGGLNPGAECIRSIGPSADDLGVQTPDLNTINDYSDYPVITSTSITMNVNGWSATSSSENGATLTAYMITVDDEGTETERTSVGTGNFPKDYNGTQSGTNPIAFSFTGLTSGHEIKRIMFKYVFSGSGTAYTYISRIDLTNVVVSYSNLNKGQFWTRTQTASAGADDPTNLEVPSHGTPHILFLTKPYTAYNYSVWSTFEYSAGATPISSGAVTWGVVGMAEDAGNCLIARFHKQSSELQLVKMRQGRETELAVYDMGATIPTSVKMEHRDGVIDVSYKNSSDTWLNPVITEEYDEETEGVISTSDDGIMHIGSWAGIVPTGFRICSFGVGDCEGIGMMAGQPTSLISTMPGTGKVTIDEIIYSYTGKTPTAITPTGPYQLRNTWLYGGYSESARLFTGYGCEISHFDPELDVAYLHDYLLCSDAGNAWLIDDTDWTVWHSTGGTPFYLFNRCRHFGDAIHNNHGLSTSNRMWETIGLTGVTRDPDQDISQSYLHQAGSWCWQYGTDQLWLTEAMGTAIENDSTVKDMTAFMCGVASVPSEFPGDWSTTSLGISGTPVQLASTERLLPGGYDVWYELPSLSSAQWVAVYASDLYIGEAGNENLDIGFRNNGGTLEVYAYPDQDTYDPVYVETPLSPTVAHSVRVLFHQNFVTVYADNIWLHTFAYPEDDLRWPDDELDMYMYASTSKTVDSVTVVELFDWREAIYVESELSAQSAIGSVIQERPVEIFPTPDGGLSFSYNLKRDTITYTTANTKVMFRRHEEKDQGNREAGSDAIVYYADVDFVTDNSFADDQGFLTRVLKLSTLDTGADRAAQILLEKANEHQYMHSLEIRPDVRIEYGDVLDFTYTLSGTGTSVSRDVIVEGISLTISEGASSMMITARKDIP
jgi:hypothetical protein